MISCPKCGHTNELGRIFCHKCGAKLNLHEIKPPKKKGGGSKSIVGWVFRVIEIAVVVGIVIAVYLMLQVPTVKPLTTNYNDLIAVDQARTDLEQRINTHTPVTVQLTESQLNAFFDSFHFEKNEGKALQVLANKLQAEIGDGDIKLILLGALKVGPSWERKISITYTGVPEVEDGEFVFQPVSGAIGALPINRQLLQMTGLFQKYFGTVFANLKQEKQLLDQVTSITAKDKLVVLKYKPATKAN